MTNFKCLIPIHIWIFLFFTIFYLITFCRTQEYGSADGSVMFRVTQSIMEDGSFNSRVAGLYRGYSYISHSKYGLGYSLAVIPLYWLTRELGEFYAPSTIESFTRRSLMATNTIITGLTCVILFSLFQLFFNNKKLSLILVFLYGFSTLAWSYARSDFSEPLKALSLIISFYYLLLAIFRQPKNHHLPNSNITIFLLISGLFFGFALFTRIATIILLPLWLALLFQLRVVNCYHGKLGNRNFSSVNLALASSKIWRYIYILYFLIPVFLFFSLYLWYNQYRFGSIWEFGYQEDFTHAINYKTILTGFIGLLFSPGKGFFWFNPILILAIFGWIYFHREKTIFSYFILLFFLSHLVLYSIWPAWEGGWCWGPRNLVPTIPFLMLGVGYWYQFAKISYFWKNAIIIILAAIGFFIQFIGMIIPYSFYIQWILDSGVPFNLIWFDLISSPIIGHFKWFLSIELHLWDFLIIQLLQLPHTGLIYSLLSILLVLWLYSGYKINKEIFRKD